MYGLDRQIMKEGLLILSILALATGPRSTAEIVRNAGLNLPSGSRHLNNLATHGYVVCCGIVGRKPQQTWQISDAGRERLAKGKNNESL
ncbi:helix-turn-helix domain-containing protein [Gloeobacter kilaueensis]|uniref:helix-turn-helix domain-containing protein n=1 Tax=Gloeobacter kilaueensis TaxID=1416614 RepID=UPI0008FF7D7E|nr:helix-turn-helix domain-containing protein [Gloeobacter kilaueensis]